MIRASNFQSMLEIIAHHLPDLTKVFFLQVFAAMSPGPDFALVVRNSLLYSREVALSTALGITAGIFIHITYSLTGLGALLIHAPVVISLIQVVGGIYLTYLGVLALKSSKKKIITSSKPDPRKHITSFSAFWSGFTTNALNVKAMFFFVSIFSVFITESTPKVILTLYGIEVLLITITWFSLVALFLSSPRIQKKFSLYSHWIERVTGCILILLGLKLAFSKIPFPFS